MSKRILYAGFLVMAFCAGILWNSRGSEHITADQYNEHSVPVPYGSPVEQKDFSTQADAIRNTEEKLSETASGVKDKLDAGSKTIDKILDAGNDVSDTVNTGTGLMQDILQKASRIINASDKTSAD